MKPKLCESLQVAHAVLAKMDVSAMIEVFGYENGREHGLMAFTYDAATKKDYVACWAQNRNSDEIVVYTSLPPQ